MKKLVILLSVICFSNDLFSQGPKSFGIFYDQDYTLEMVGIKHLNEDRNYTMGAGFYVSGNYLKNCFAYEPLYFLNRIFKRPFLNDKKNSNSDKNSVSLMLANGTFTPDSLADHDPIYNDRPYASLTYLEFKTVYVDNKLYKKYSSNFNIGILGTFISREVQTAIHVAQNDGDTKNPRTPRGWEHQVSSGGELTLLYSGELEKLISTKAVRDETKTSIFGLEFKHGLKYSLGYYTLANYNFSFRFGKIDPRNWSYVTNPLANSTMLRGDYAATDAGTYFSRPLTSEYYFYTSLRPTFVLYNALLNGQFRHSDVRVSFGDMRHFVLDGEIGLCLAPVITPKFIITGRARFAGRSPEIEFETRPVRSHFWGGLDLVFTWF